MFDGVFLASNVAANAARVTDAGQTMKMPSRRQVLFLDYDNSIHRSDVYRTTDGLVHADLRGILFEYAPVLEQMITPYPNVEIVLSTSWVGEVGFKRARDSIPLPALRARVVGATYDNCLPDSGKFKFEALPRGTQILLYVKQHALDTWLAIDDRRDGFESCPERLIHCQPSVGLGDRDVQALAKMRLHTMFNVGGRL